MEENKTELVKVDDRKIRKSVLDDFNRISDRNPPTRHKFGLILLKHLGDNNHQKEDNPELKYAISRLIRGLGASKLESKIGHYTALVGLLQTCESISVDDVLQCVKKQLQTGDSKSELADVYTGQILACGALLRSGLFDKGSLDEKSGILQQIFAAGRKRSYLPLAASVFIADLLLKIEEKKFRKTVWPVLQKEVVKIWSEQDFDSLYLLAVVVNRFPHILKDANFQEHFGVDGLFTESNMEHICVILMNIPGISSLKHPGYTVITQEIAKSNAVLPFITHLNGLLLKPNRNRILAVALIIKNLFKSPEALPHLPELLPDNFIKQILDYYNFEPDQYTKGFLQEMTNFFTALCNCCKESVDDKLKVGIIKRLLFKPGTFMFERITKSKILHQLINCLTEKGVTKLSKVFRGVIAGDKEKGTIQGWLNSERIDAGQLLVRMLNLPCMQNNMEWKKKQLKLLINVSIIKHSDHLNVGVELSGAFTDIFYRALDLKFSKLEDVRDLLLDLVSHITTVVTPENYKEVIRQPLTDDEFQIWQKTLTIINKLSKKTKKHWIVFHILFLHMSLQLFKEKDLAISSLKELFLCYERFKKVHKEETHEPSVNEPEWIEVVIDLFLNLLSHNSHLLRNVVTHVFPHLCQYMTPSSLHQILSVLDPNNETNPLSKNDSDDEDIEDENTESEGENESESESESDDEEEKETVNDRLRMAVSKALGNDEYKTDEESIDLDNMDEDEGEKLDKALAEAFKQFKPNHGKNKKQSKDEETLTHFRIRVLDLLESYLNSKPSMLSTFEIMVSLLQVLEFSVRDHHQTPLRTRTTRCLKTLTKLNKLEVSDEVTPEIICDLLNSLLVKGTKSALVYQEMSNEISDCCIYVLHCAKSLDEGEALPKRTRKKIKSGLIQIITDALGMFFNNRDCLIPYGFFKSIFGLHWNGTFTLIPVVFNYAFAESTRPFRQSQAFELLNIFYKNSQRKNSEIFRESVKEHDVQLCNKIVSLLDQFCANPQTIVIKGRFIYHVFTLLRLMSVRHIKNEEINWAAIGEKIREYRSYVTLPTDAKLAYNQLCRDLGIPSSVKMKNEVVKVNHADANEETEHKIKPQKRKSSTSESKKLRKQTRDLRIQSMSEGISDSFVFSSSNLMNLNQNDEEEHIKHVKNDSPLVNGTSRVIKKRSNSEGEETPHKKKKKHK